MELLIAVNNPLPGIEIIELYAPNIVDHVTTYPVKIDNEVYYFYVDEHSHWKPVDPGAELSDEVVGL